MLYKHALELLYETFQHLENIDSILALLETIAFYIFQRDNVNMTYSATTVKTHTSLYLYFSIL